MAKKNRESSLSRVTKAFQDNVRRSGPAAGASYGLVGAVLLLGGLGYAFDNSRGTAPWGLVVGLMLGIIVGFYQLAKTMWRK